MSEQERSDHKDIDPSSDVAAPEDQSPTRVRPNLVQEPFQGFNQDNRSRPAPISTDGQLSPEAADRVYPIRSVVSMDPNPTPGARGERHEYFGSASNARRMSTNAGIEHATTPGRARQSSADRIASPRTSGDHPRSQRTDRQASTSTTASMPRTPQPPTPAGTRQQPHVFSDMMTGDGGSDTQSQKSGQSQAQSDKPSERPAPIRSTSIKSGTTSLDEVGPHVTARFKHVVSEGGHAIITGRDGDTLQRCEDEPIHIPGAVQGFGLLIALEEQQEGKLIVRVVSENCKRLIGYSPMQLFALESFTDILSEEQADNLLDHVDFIRDEDADVVVNGPEVFTLSIRSPQKKNQKFWCAMHINEANPDLVICEFELEDDQLNPLQAPNDSTPEPPEDTLNSQPTEEELVESTHNTSKPLRVLRSARKRKGEAAAMEVFNIMSQVQEQLAAAPTLESFLKILVGVIKELTGFHRVMIYQFDHSWNGRVVTELIDPRATKDLYKGLNFPASDIPKQARELYKVNKVRMLYDRDQETARLVCRTVEDLETPLDLTYSYLRAMSPIHLKYLANMAVRSSMSISINAFDELWGLIACHTYGPRGMRVSFPIRKMCRLVGDSASRNIERLSYASRLQARKLINTVPTQANPSGYIIASSEDLLKLFDADFGLLSIHGETKIMGNVEHTQEALAMLEYLRMRCITNVMTSQDIAGDFPDLRYTPGFTEIAGLLLVPLSAGGQDFIVFFRRGQLREVKWAGNPYEKFIKEGTEGYLEPRKSFKTWSETVVGKCREWSEEEIETAAVLCLVYGKFIEVWRQKEAALQNSQLTKLLLANSAHEVRTPLNAIINYLEIAMEGSLDQETRDNLTKSHSASKSLIYVINDLLDLTKTEEGGELVKDEVFDLGATLFEATDMFKGDARRKNITYNVQDLSGLTSPVIGDQRRVRQAISNVTANAIQNTVEGGVTIEMYVASRESPEHVDVEISVADTGCGMNSKKLDALFRDLEQVQMSSDQLLTAADPDSKSLRSEDSKSGEGRTLGLGLAVVARIIRNMNGQLRLKSEEGKGSRFVIQFPFDLPEPEEGQKRIDEGTSSVGSATPMNERTSSLNTSGQGSGSGSGSSATATVTTPPTGDTEGMMTLIERSSSGTLPARRNSAEVQGGGASTGLSRKSSRDSFQSKKSLNSMLSARSTMSKSSNRSAISEADRLIEAIQEPHRVEGWQDGSVHRSTSRGNTMSARPMLSKRHSTAGSGGNSITSPLKHRPRSIEVAPVPDHMRSQKLATTSRPSSSPSKPGESMVTDQGTPVRSIRIPDHAGLDSPKDDGFRSPAAHERALLSTTLLEEPPSANASSKDGESPRLDTHHMRVLVAEDDPVNSRIMKKRLEKLGHEVVLTVNGEECSSMYCDNPGQFDIVLMDMQMPIVDGLTSGKMIRSFETTHPTPSPTPVLSPRAALNGRVPIIAVSASLEERNLQTYIRTGFDGWILKPISFPRLSEIMEGIVDPQVRRENLYRAGGWERGGWFEEGKKAEERREDVVGEKVDLKPSERPPVSKPSEGVKIAAVSDGPEGKEEHVSEQSREQERLLAVQKEGREEGGVKEG
ncbi:unnamed protein product [Zymoseptoria tritici ST99CH_1A5]|uniref:Phytochrome n=1 Tax=Zymoseptoria tritici ST99CH_1A5 TaxID=1276529 RepID=A0A1Y6LIM8_ZYMTR|nr:unnamed protein product [Zymoseptoria tritici ST99CH_1A5]